MTLSTTANRTRSEGNGVTVTFNFPYYFLADADLTVIYTDSDGVESDPLTLDTDYTVSGAGDPSGGSITLIGDYAADPPDSGEYITIIRDPEAVQEADYTENDDFPAETHEKALDKLTMLHQALLEKMARAVLMLASSAYSDLTLPDPVAGRVLAWASDLSGLENFNLADISALAVTDFMKTVLDDADASTALSTLGFSAFIKTLIDDADASAALSTLGFSAFIKTLIDDADAATARATLGVGQAETLENLPVGFVFKAIATETPPTGSLELDGSALSMTTYSDLFTGHPLSIGNAFGMDAGAAFTADAGTDVLTSAAHGRSDDDILMLSNSGGALPAGLSAATVYYVINATTDTFKVSTSKGGAAVDITDAGTGTHKFHYQFKLDDTRGMFYRGWDHGAGTDPDAAGRTDRGDGTTGDHVGTKQADELESHNHEIDPKYLTFSGGTADLGTGGTRTWGQYTESTGGNETRPINTAVMWCIKY